METTEINNRIYFNFLSNMIFFVKSVKIDEGR